MSEHNKFSGEIIELIETEVEKGFKKDRFIKELREKINIRLLEEIKREQL